MKFKYSSYSIILTLIVAILLLSVVNFNCGLGHPHDSVITDTTTEFQYVDDSLPHRDYQRIQDSLFAIEQCKKAKQNNCGAMAQAWSIGFSNILESNDSCGGRILISGKRPITNRYFLTLSGYDMKKDCEYILENGQPQLKYVVWDKKIKNSWSDKWSGHIERKALAVRFFPQLVPSTGDVGQGTVFIPISKKSYDTLRIVVFIIGYTMVFAFIIAMVGLPLSVLFAIGNGRAFATRTIRRLHFAAYVYVVASILPGMVQYILYLVYSRVIPTEIHLAIPYVFLQNKNLLLIGLVMLMVAKAFKTGQSTYLTIDEIEEYKSIKASQYD